MSSKPLKRHLKRVVNKTWNFSGRLKPALVGRPSDHLLNAVLGLVGEAGEIADLHKKWFYHTPKEGRLEELKLELGDLLYYLTKLLDFYCLDLDEILELNYRKLKARHPQQFAKGGKRVKR